MKNKFLYLLIIFTSVLSISAQSFVGVIQFQNENFEAGEKSDITCYLKSPLCKMDIRSTSKEGTTQYTLYFDDRSSEVVMIAGGNKTIIPISVFKENKYLQNIWMTVEKGNPISIAGYNCKQVELKTNTSSILCYVSTELDANFPVVINNGSIIKALNGINIKGIPLSIEVKDLSGKDLFSQKVVSIEIKNLNESELKAP